jgi:hypothetical protein
MNESQVDVMQLQKRDPQAWTVLLSSQKELQDVVVTAVVAQPLYSEMANDKDSRHLTRYLVSLANHSDPIPFIGKKTSSVEALFYRDLAQTAPSITPRCWYTHIADKQGWIILDEVPSHVRVDKWQAENVEDVIDQMAMLHTTFWNQPELSRRNPWLPHFIGRKENDYSWDELRRDHAIYFEQGPAAPLSDHALEHIGRLAPKFLEAANGLAVMEALSGWPGVLGESHLAAAADLIDDPVPMLEPLQRLPPTLLHGQLHAANWHLTLFNDHRLLDWRNVEVGPGIYDLIFFQEHFNLIHSIDSFSQPYFRYPLPITEETLIDSYLLAMKKQLGSMFDARLMRSAIPAARCLFIITNWFPHFASWFDKMPDKYMWQRLNRMSEVGFNEHSLQPMIGFRIHLKGVFQRFLQAYRML